MTGKPSRGGSRNPHAPEPAATDELEITVKPLTRARFDDLVTLFEQGGDPRWCWCMYYRKRGMNWSNSSRADNRRDLQSIAGSRPAPGLVAYARGAAVGWVSLAPRERYERLVANRFLRPIDDKPVWSVVCFVVSRTARRRGVATKLLEAAIDYARQHGAAMLEAYPISAERGKVAAAAAFRGVESMFKKAGFRVAEVRRWNETAPPQPIMRLALR